MSDDLTFERLEDRMLLAGSVTAYQKGATLYLIGDASANDFDLTGALDVDGNLIQGGVVVSDGPLPSMTEINNTFGPEVFLGIKNIVIQSGAGDDIVRVQGIQILGDLKANLGEGVVGDQFIVQGHPDQVFGGPFRYSVIGGSLTVNAALGVDDDGVFIQEARIGRAVIVTTGAGDDDVRLWLGALVGGKTTVNTGAGEDGIFLTGSIFNGAVSLAAGTGDDIVNLLDTFGNNIFNAAVAAAGGAGTDDLNDNGTNVFARPPKYSGFEL